MQHLINNAINDISQELANRSHAGTSFSPEKRGESWRADYVESLTNDLQELENFCESDQERETLVTEFPRYRENLASKYRDYLHSHSQVISAMITGPARFPVARNEKRSQWAHNKLEAISEFREKAKKAIKRKIRPTYHAGGAIMSNDPEAVTKLKNKLASLKESHQYMKDINAAYRKAKKPEPGDDEGWQKVAELSGASDSMIKEIRQQMARFSYYSRPFESYALSNNNANIKNAEKRLKELESMKSAETVEHVTDGLRVVENTEAARIQLFFDDKPPADVRSTLKSNGFRWAPSVGAWQRQLTSNGKYATARILTELNIQL